MGRFGLRVDDELLQAVRTKMDNEDVDVRTISDLVRTLLLQWLNGEQAKPLVVPKGAIPVETLETTKPEKIQVLKDVEPEMKPASQIPAPDRCVCGGTFHPVSGRCFRCSKRKPVNY